MNMYLNSPPSYRPLWSFVLFPLKHVSMQPCAAGLTPEKREVDPDEAGANWEAGRSSELLVFWWWLFPDLIRLRSETRGSFLALGPPGVTSFKHLWVFRELGSRFLLLLKPPWVRHLDVTSFSGCCLVHDSFKAGFQHRVVHRGLGVGTRTGGRDGGGVVGQKLCRDFIENFGLGLFSPQESQLPPAGGGISHEE